MKKHASTAVIKSADFLAALDAEPDAKQRFEKLSYTHRREYVKHITDAKKEDTRLRRIEKTIDTLLSSYGV
jgi:uncharacterized protein YdeI (YjbR/CyaY-like superfamily)